MSLDAGELGERAQLCAARIEALRALLERRGAAAMVLRARRDFAWLTAGGLNHVLLSTEAGAAPLVVTPRDALVLAPVNEHRRIVDEEISGLPLRAESLPWWDAAASAAAIRDLAAGGDVLDEADPSAGNGADLGSELTALRSLLAPLEHFRMARLAELVRAAADGALARIEPGQAEDEVVAGIAGAITAGGARLPVLLAAADERIERYRHPLPARAPIRRRLMVVIVAERWGLHVAHTQFAELEPRPAELARRALALGDVLGAMREATRPGNTLGDVLRAARQAYEANVMADEWTLHHQGGTIGYQAREQIATPDDDTPVLSGMAFAWNPSAPGFKLEETLYLDGTGRQRVLTTTRL